MTIKETSKVDIIVAIDFEQSHLRGLADTISLLKDSPAALAAAEAYIPRNAVMNGIYSDLKKYISPRVEFIGSIEYAINQLLKWIPSLKKSVMDSKTSVYDDHTLTFKEKGILDIFASINFFNRYTTLLLDILITQADKEVSMTSFVSKLNMTFFNNTAKYYSSQLVKFSSSIKDLDTLVSELSEELVDEASAKIIAAQSGEKAVNAVRGFAPHHLLPMYWWLRRQMKKDLATLTKTSEDIDMLAMKIARLNNRRTGTEDPTLERQIEIYQDELTKKQAKIYQIEARYGNGV